MTGALARRQEYVFSAACVGILPYRGIWIFPSVPSFAGVLQNSQNLWVRGSTIAVLGLTVNRSLGGEKIVLHIVYFACSLLPLLLVVFTLLSYQTVFISTHKFPILSISHPHPAREEGGGERAAARWNHNTLFNKVLWAYWAEYYFHKH